MSKTRVEAVDECLRDEGYPDALLIRHHESLFGFARNFAAEADRLQTENETLCRKNADQATQLRNFSTYYERVEAENDRLQATVDKLPKCWGLKDGKLVQDVPVVPSVDNVYERRHVNPDRTLVVMPVRLINCHHASSCYSTREAAEAKAN